MARKPIDSNDAADSSDDAADRDRRQSHLERYLGEAVYRARAGDHRAPTDFVQFKLRIRAPLVKRLQKAADKKKQSANNEAVQRLEQSFSGEAQEMHASATLDLMLGMVAKNADIKDVFSSIIYELERVDLTAIDAKDLARSVRVAISSAVTAAAAWKHDIEAHNLKPEPKR